MNISPRQQVAQNLAACISANLNDSYGVSVQRATDKKGRGYWSVLFCKARITDGSIRVYSQSFILVSWQTANRTLEREGSQVFRSEADARAFIVNTFA